MTHQPPDSAQLCSRLSRAADEQAVGSAAEASCWVVLEQDGPWGARAAIESRLDPDFGARMDAAVTAVGGRFALMREPGAHVDRHRGHRRLLIAGGPVEAPWLVHGTVERPERLLDLPVDSLGDPSPAKVLTALPDLRIATGPVLLVCTNGKRDRCCAMVGRPVAETAHRARPKQVFETTHLGGHRFATTAVMLPSGHTYARLDPQSVEQVLAEAERGLVPAVLADEAHYRGRSGLTRPQQVAEHAYRVARDDRRLPGPVVGEAVPIGTDHWDVRVGSGAERVGIRVARSVGDRLRPESCGKDPVPVPHWSATLHEVASAD